MSNRSTRFLNRLGYEAVGLDISASMVERASAADPNGRYVHAQSGDFSKFGDKRFDLVLSAFAFDNIPGEEQRAELLRRLRGLLSSAGRVVLLGSTPEIYTHEWSSFTTARFRENASARSGEVVRIIMKDVPDARPVVDLIWFDADYQRLFDAAGFEIAEQHYPLGRASEPYSWISETTVAPWVVYVIRQRSPALLVNRTPGP